MEILKSSRVFVLFDVHVTFGRVQLRSFSNNVYEQNVDITFSGVSHISIPTSFIGLTLIQSESASSEKIFNLTDDNGVSGVINGVLCKVSYHSDPILVKNLKGINEI